MSTFLFSRSEQLLFLLRPYDSVIACKKNLFCYRELTNRSASQRAFFQVFGFCFIIFVCLQLSAQEKMKKRMQMMLNKQRKTLNRRCLWFLLIKISIFYLACRNEQSMRENVQTITRPMKSAMNFQLVQSAGNNFIARRRKFCADSPHAPYVTSIKFCNWWEAREIVYLQNVGKFCNRCKERKIAR